MEKFGFGVAVFLFVCIFTLLINFLFVACWNYVIPHVFGLPTIGYWQGIALYVVAMFMVKTINVNSSK